VSDDIFKRFVDYQVLRADTPERRSFSDGSGDEYADETDLRGLIRAMARLGALLALTLLMVEVPSPLAEAATTTASVERQLRSGTWTLASLPNGVSMTYPLTLTMSEKRKGLSNTRGYAFTPCNTITFIFVVKANTIEFSSAITASGCLTGRSFVQGEIFRSFNQGAVPFRISKDELVLQTGRGPFRYVRSTKFRPTPPPVIPVETPVAPLVIADMQGTWKQQSIVIDDRDRFYWPNESTILTVTDNMLALSHPCGSASWAVVDSNFNGDRASNPDVNRIPCETNWYTSDLAFGNAIDPKRSGLLADGRLLIAGEAYEMIWERA
jgi:hypothetical protein